LVPLPGDVHDVGCCDVAIRVARGVSCVRDIHCFVLVIGADKVRIVVGPVFHRDRGKDLYLISLHRFPFQVASNGHPRTGARNSLLGDAIERGACRVVTGEVRIRRGSVALVRADDVRGRSGRVFVDAPKLDRDTVDVRGVQNVDGRTRAGSGSSHDDVPFLVSSGSNGHAVTPDKPLATDAVRGNVSAEPVRVLDRAPHGVSFHANLDDLAHVAGDDHDVVNAG